MKLVDLIRHKKKYNSPIIEGEDDKYVSIGYGRYKRKGQEDNENADIYSKTDDGKYIKADQGGSNQGGASAAGGQSGSGGAESNLDKDEFERDVNEDLDTPAKYSSNEAKLHIDADIKKMSKFLGKASQECIKIMMDGVKGGRYDALDIQRGIKFGPFNRTHEGERPFMSMLWNKVRSGFRRYMPKGKLRK